MRRRSVLLLLFALSLGCHSIQPPEENDTPQTPDDWQHVRDAFREIVRHAQAGDRAAIAERLRGFVLTEAEMVTLFGPEKGPEVHRGYLAEIVGDLVREAPDVIIEKVGEGLTEVEVDRLGPARAANTTPGDKVMIEALAKKRPVFNLRLRKPTERLGLRFDGFVFVDGNWRFLFKSYRFLGHRPDTGD